MATSDTSFPTLEAPPPLSTLDRFLRVFGDVRAGEGGRVVLMFLNVFLLLLAYYILKTVREPLILQGGGAELKTYAGAAQALTLVFYVPLYGWVASRLPRQRLIVAVVLFFFATLELFFFAGRAEVPRVGFAFYVWAGVFNLTMVAQFWSYANDVYSRPEGERLFPLIAIGSTIGAPLGSLVAARLFATGMSPFVLMQIAAVLLLAHLGLYLLVFGDWTESAAPAPPLEKKGGFSLVLRSRYLLLFAGMLILLNFVNTIGEYILDRYVTAAAHDTVAAAVAQRPGLDEKAKVAVERAFIGEFKGNYLTGVNVTALVLQAFVVSRLVRFGGIAAVLLFMPVVSLGSYTLAAAGASLSLLRWVKTAENGSDYSVMNSAKQLLWLPTTREEKYKGKQAIDTFFVRMGDMAAGGFVFLGTHHLGLGARGFALFNVALVLVWLYVAWRVLRENRRLTGAEEAKAAPVGQAAAAPA
jgi:AAA family ATP:ADP antiporter